MNKPRNYATGKLHVKATHGEITEVYFLATDPSKLANVQEGNTFVCLATKSKGHEYLYVLGVVDSVTSERVNLAPRFTFFKSVDVLIDQNGIKVDDTKGDTLRVFNVGQDVVLHAITPIDV
jgi:hypothetical protein